MRDGKLFPFVCVFTGIFGVRKVQCYLSVQVIVLLEKKVSGEVQSYNKTTSIMKHWLQFLESNL